MPVSATLSLEVHLLGGENGVSNLPLGTGSGRIAITGSGVVTVSGGSVLVPAGLFDLTSKVTVPVTGASALHSLRLLTGFRNAAASFQLGGVTSQAPGEVCPGTGNRPGDWACNVGGGLGGTMALTGPLIARVQPQPGIVFVLDLNDEVRIGQGGSTNLPFDVDAAAWTTGTGVVDLSDRPDLSFHGTGSPLVLVTPVYLGVFDAAIVGTLSLAVPEPSAFLLLVAGSSGLWLLRRR